MNEHLLQFIWGNRYYNSAELKTVGGSRIIVKYPGRLNANQGPDFLDAQIMIDELLLAGSVELHLRSSDWKQHRHDEDLRYSNVVLHVVWEHDGWDLPYVQVLELKHRVAIRLLDTYQKLMQSKGRLPCESLLQKVPEMVLTSWKDRLLVSRFENRSKEIATRLVRCRNSLEEAFWQTLAFGWGLPLNADVFEAVAVSLPVSILSKHRQQAHQMEALLFGQAGLLDNEFQEVYPQMLQKEYRFLQRKYGLRPVDVAVSFLRMRPPEFPTIRLAQLAMLLCHSGFFFSSIKIEQDLKTLIHFFEITASEYWTTHYRFEQESIRQCKHTGYEMIHRLLINSVFPFLYYVACAHKDQGMKQRVQRWLYELPPENNSRTRLWLRAGVGIRHAFDSQALLELRKNYCDQKRCLECAIGNRILRQEESTS
jgi:hypothetical protein